MEALFVLAAGLYGLGLPIAVIFLLVRGGRLARENAARDQRLQALEVQMAALREDQGTETPKTARSDAKDAQPDPETVAPDKSAPAQKERPAARPSDPWGAGRIEPATIEAVRPVVTKSATRRAATAPKAPQAVSAFDRALSGFATWITQNWVYAVAAVSLALAGLFLVQYGIENGLLPPTARVLAALGFGAALVGGGEYLRKRWGDGEDSPAAFLPSVFSGAGIVTLFGAVLSARHLYDLIGPTTCFAGLLAVAGGAIVLGWLTGPLLSALGLVGAFVAPFLLGGNSDATPVVGYLGIVTLMGLAIDAYRRWHWLSALSLGLGHLGLFVLVAAADVDPEWVIGFALILPFATIVVMGWRLWPALPGRALLPALMAGRLREVPRRLPRRLPRRMALLHLVIGASTLWLLASAQAGAAEFWLSALALTTLSGGMAIWARGSAAMEDLPILPTLGVIGLVWLEQTGGGAVYRDFTAALPEGADEGLRTAPLLLVAMAAFLGGIAAWRSLSGAWHSRVWAGAAALIAPAMLISLEVAWTPTQVIGTYPWAITAMALAALMVWKLERFARAGDADRMRLSLVLMSALGLISFALMLVLSPSALTVALAVAVLVAVELDRRYDLPLLAWFAVIGAILTSARLVLDPGLPWAQHAPVWQVSFAYLGAIFALGAAWVQGKARGRMNALVTLESAVLSLVAIYAALMLGRGIEALTGDHGSRHWSAGLNALIWLVATAVQGWRLKLGGKLAKLRLGLGGIYGVLALGYLSLALTVDNPFLTYGERIHGLPIFSTLAVAYALPALILLLVARHMRHLHRSLRLGLLISGAGLILFWIAAEIAHFWRGAVLAGETMRQPELYTYTVALLILGGGLLYHSIARRSDLLRRVAMGAIALTVAKVFLVDISGLDGLMRVFSFLALGLSLAGLAWLNRWAAMRSNTIKG